MWRRRTKGRIGRKEDDDRRKKRRKEEEEEGMVMVVADLENLLYLKI